MKNRVERKVVTSSLRTAERHFWVKGLEATGHICLVVAQTTCSNYILSQPPQPLDLTLLPNKQRVKAGLIRKLFFKKILTSICNTSSLKGNLWLTLRKQRRDPVSDPKTPASVKKRQLTIICKQKSVRLDLCPKRRRPSPSCKQCSVERGDES